MDDEFVIGKEGCSNDTSFSICVVEDDANVLEELRNTMMSRDRSKSYAGVTGLEILQEDLQETHHWIPRGRSNSGESSTWHFRL